MHRVARQLDSTEGVGPVEVYRAVSAETNPPRQEPMFWARRKWEFNRLHNEPDPALAAEIHGNRQTPQGLSCNVPKLWAEIAFEHARRRLAPASNSRLDALYAWADPLDAFLFIDSTPIGAVWKGEVAAGVRWQVMDFSLFEVVQIAQPSMQAYSDAWDELLEHAARYWTPVSELERPEVRVAGTVNLSEKVELRPILEQAGVLKAAAG